LGQFAKTGNFKDFNINMIEAEVSEEHSALHKGDGEVRMRSRDLSKKSWSPNPNGETKPNNEYSPS
jgi:hypothetical protein